VVERHDGDQRTIVLAGGKVVMSLNDLDQFRAKFPALSKKHSALTMSYTQHLHLGFMQRNVGGFRQLYRLCELVRYDPEMHHHAKIVKQSRQVRFFRIAIADLLCEPL